MSIKTLGAKITGKFAKQTLVVKEASPVLLAGVGIVGVIATAVLASRATLKVAAVLQEAEENLSKVETEGTDADETKKSVFSTQVRTAIEIAKIYAPAVIVGGLTVASFTGSIKILRARNAALSAAYAATNAAYNKYRERVIADQGEGKDREYVTGAVATEIVEEGENGPETKTTYVSDENSEIASPYSRVFDEFNRNWQRTPGANAMIIQGHQGFVNDLLESRGYVFLNEVYDLLGFEATEAGQIVGWVKNSENGDNHISFGIWANGFSDGKYWINRGGKDPIRLDFNVDGEIAKMLKTI